jgi:hypothetical protein
MVRAQQEAVAEELALQALPLLVVKMVGMAELELMPTQFGML